MTELIYLCTMDDLASGVDPDFHQLWAPRPEFPRLGDNGRAPEVGA